ncbi:MAG: hypothetical protein ACYCVH_04365 [Ignavibacteriaceae bacterium]
MKKIIFYSFTFISIFLLTSCNNTNPLIVDNRPPSPPTGVQVLNGDNIVDISWNKNPGTNVAGYNVYYSLSYNGKYTLIGSTQNNYYTDNGAQNGSTYYYAVTAYDFNGNESALSYDNVSATPRPEGFNATVFDYRNFPNTGGFSFTTYSDVTYNDKSADFFFENYNGNFFIDVWKDSDIQDMGPTNDIYDISYAPTSGWSSTKDAAAIVGHTYVIWTWDNHYAKIRVKSITNERMVFDWAFQNVAGNVQLKQSNVPTVRGPLDNSTLNRH